MNPTQKDQHRLERAKQRVKKIKGFYRHLLIYIIINLLIIILNIQSLAPGESYFQIHNFITFTFWGIAIIIHALTTFLPNFILGSNWEERKIKEIIEKDESVWE